MKRRRKSIGERIARILRRKSKIKRGLTLTGVGRAWGK